MRICQPAVTCLLAVCLAASVCAAEPASQEPRKALLRIEKLPAEPLTISVFKARADSFRTPLFRGTVGPEGIEIASGDLVLALEAKGHAPDLQRLSVPPGARLTVSYHARDGWSLLVRCREASGAGATVAGAQVSTSGRTETTGGDGLALLNGLSAAEAVKVHHPRFLDQSLAAPPAEPGVYFAVDALLARGASVTARILANARPAAGVSCAVLPAGGRSTKLSEGTTGGDGLYRSSRLPAGSYVLRVSSPQSRVPTDQPFTLRDGEDARLEIALGAIRLTGRVQRSGEPAPGYSIEAVADNNGGAPAGLPSLHAVTDKSGEYSGTLWTPGDYTFRLRSPNGNPVGAERRVSLGRPEETVDFDLNGATVSGKVVDDKGQPVEAAQVTLTWNGGQVSGLSGQGGAFELLTETAGMAVLTASKPGVGAAIGQRVMVNSDTGASGVTIVIQREGAVKKQ